MTAASASVCRGCAMCRPHHPVMPPPAPTACVLCRGRWGTIQPRGEHGPVCTECAMDMPTVLVGQLTTEGR